MTGIPIRVRDVQLATAAVLGVKAAEIRGPRRDRRTADARQLAMAIARDMTGQTLQHLGLYFHRDHATVHHGIRVALARLQADAELAAQAEHIRALALKSAAAFHAWKGAVALENSRQPETTP